MVEWLDTSKVLWSVCPLTVLSSATKNGCGYSGQGMTSPQCNDREGYSGIFVDRIERAIVTNGYCLLTTLTWTFFDSIENNYNALAEEDARATEFFKDEIAEDSVSSGDGSFESTSSIHALRSASSPLNWCLRELLLLSLCIVSTVNLNPSPDRRSDFHGVCIQTLPCLGAGPKP